MPGFIGLPEILLLGLVALIVFGPKRLPEMGKSLGGGLREFKRSIGGDDDHLAPPTTVAAAHDVHESDSPFAHLRAARPVAPVAPVATAPVATPVARVESRPLADGERVSV